MSPDRPSSTPPGPLGTVRAAVNAGALVGVLAGTFGGWVRTLGIDPGLFLIRIREQGIWTALTHGLPRFGDLPGLLGCTAAAALTYSAAGVAIAVPAALLIHRWLRPKTMVQRYQWLLGAGFGVWFCAEFYWWTRSEIYPGLSATSPRRLAVAALIAAVSLAAGFLAARQRTRLPRGLRLSTPFLIMGVVLIGGAYLLADSGGGERGRRNARTRDMPNVLLVVVDALRQDVLGCYGAQDVATPRMDELARDGVLFENAFVQAPFTWSSFGSLLTGKYPRRHGLVKMEPGYRLPANITLPFYLHGAQRVGLGALEERDVVGAAFLTGTLSHGSGLAQGFDYYFEALVGHELVDVHSRWSLFRSGLLPWLYKNKLHQRLDASLVASTAVDWLRKNGRRRFMVMVHYYSTHTPYDPPQQYRKMYCDPDYDGPLRIFDAAGRKAIEEGLYSPTAADRRQIRDLYRAGVTQADDMLGMLVDELQYQGVLDDTIVVLTSDHGESLGEHGLWEHNHMYQDNLRIPLILRWPRGLLAGTRVSAAVDSIDLMPTLVELLGLEALPGADGLDEQASHSERIGAVDGLSLVPLIRGAQSAVRPYSFAENGRYRSIQDGRWKLIVRREQLDPEVWEQLLGDPRELDPHLPRFFDLEEDPGELHNRFADVDYAHRERISSLHAALRAWSTSLPIRDDLVRLSGRDLDAERLFHGLGYSGGVGEDEEQDAKENDLGDGEPEREQPDNAPAGQDEGR